MIALPEKTESVGVIPTGSLAAGVLRAQESAHALRDVGSLKRVATDLIETAAQIGCRHMVAANAAAEPLATAAALLSEGALTFSDKAHSLDKVLVVEAATVSGDVARSCAADLRANGASWVGVVIYDRVRPDLDGLDDEPAIDFVTSLQTLSQ
ncbi:hypothetical protein [Mycobacterium simiae]|uniref:hypothetical protein n=1 Tax=Mycobacterium simiae TaxID=1784 RepID=UPI00261A8D81|nr:hypothetical protein [Mycobacterium simiae]